MLAEPMKAVIEVSTPQMREIPFGLSSTYISGFENSPDINVPRVTANRFLLILSFHTN